jgi:hypothetical protein
LGQPGGCPIAKVVARRFKVPINWFWSRESTA